MPAAKTTAGQTDSTSDAQARFVVSLPKDLRDIIVEMGKRVSAKVEAETGVGIDMTPAQVVTAVVKTAHRQQQQADTDAAAASDNGEASA